LIIYNHGLISFASENTSLAEELASHGFSVIAIQHAEQLAELKALSASQSPEKKRNDAALTRALREAVQKDRAQRAVEYYEASTNTNRIVIDRSVDTSFVLDHVGELLQEIPGAGPHSIDAAAAHLVGFSVGGAVATEVAKHDSRAASVVNLDGGMHGTVGRGELHLPYLMMYSAANDGMNDALLPTQAQRAAPADTAHLNYHDISALVPGLRLMGAIGRVDPTSFLRQRNTVVREFCTKR
jgi:dienelactone hydrolase